ncbi:MAG: hypothetical protein Q4D79_07485 [Propionibacteriaceae bacterium]|nr:hypothetical protein [Propionibacteriaceae bacterium]
MSSGGGREPVHGELQHDAIRRRQSLLFGCDINMKVRVDVVHAAHDDVAAETLGLLGQGAVDPRGRHVGMEHEYEGFHG